MNQMVVICTLNQLTDLLRYQFSFTGPRAVLESYQKIEESMEIIRVKNKFNKSYNNI